MNTSTSRLLVVLLGLAASCGTSSAAPLTFDAPLHLRPDDAAPVVATLPAGTSVDPLVRDEFAAEGIDALPPGWVAVHYPGPIYGFVLDADIGKDLTARPGAVVRVAPEAEAPVIVMVAAGDKAEMVSTEGEWAKVALDKEVLLFLSTVPPGSRRQLVDVASADVPGMAGPAAPDSEDAASAAGPDPAEAAPRMFEGFFMRTRRILGAGPKLDYQLVDERGKRIALLDLSALLVMEPLENYEGHPVSIFGTGKSVPGVGDLVIRVETLRLRR